MALSVTYCEEDDAGGLHGVLWRKHNPAVVNSPIKIRIWGPTNGKVPFKEVVLKTEVNVTLNKYYTVNTCHCAVVHFS